MKRLRDAILDEIDSIQIDDLGYTDDGYTKRELEIFRRLKDSCIEVVLTLVSENKTTMDRICSDKDRKERIIKGVSKLINEDNNDK